MLPLALICAALVALLAWDRIQNRREREEWARERQLLITRIQHPEIVVTQPEAAPVPDEEYLTAEPDDLDLVGTVQVGNGY